MDIKVSTDGQTDRHDHKGPYFTLWVQNLKNYPFPILRNKILIFKTIINPTPMTQRAVTFLSHSWATTKFENRNRTVRFALVLNISSVNGTATFEVRISHIV